MKKQILAIAALFLLVVGCNKSSSREETVAENKTTTDEIQRSCASYDVLQAQLQADPTLEQRMQNIEEFTNKVINNPAQYRLVGSDIVIPVVFNVIYNTAAENISDAQLQSQIDVLNEDYAATNTDYSSVPAIFQGVRAGNTNIKFELDVINRKFNSKTSWSPNDGMKSASTGGIDATSPATKLNIWVVNYMPYGSGQILGYAQFPGGAPATDGVVLGQKFTGRIGTVSAPFNKGRTATHEVGHWMNLRHIWGDARCGNDLVADTPAHDAENTGCPAANTRSKCPGKPIEMTMNYMDYSNDACMYMFSAGQKDRMKAVFAAGGPRFSFAQP